MRRSAAVFTLSILLINVCSYAAENQPAEAKSKPRVKGWARQRVEEKLDRGLVALPTEDGKVYLSWRLLKSDAAETTFNVYRRTSAGAGEKLNDSPLSVKTDFIDTNPDITKPLTYWVVPIHQEKELAASEAVAVAAGARFISHYKSIKLRGDIIAGKVALADLNGDGKYDFIVRHPNVNVDPGVGGSNQTGVTYKIDAYLSDGTFLWRKDLGPGIEPGIWYSPMVVQDLDGDGKAEVILKTAPMNLKRDKGRIHSGFEWCSVLDGMTGKEITFIDWLPRDSRLGGYNTTNRNQLGIAYLDGKTPCVIVARGTYRLMMAAAYQLQDNKLERLWYWEGDEETPIIRGQGAHTMTAADVDSDGRDEVLLGSCVLDDNGTLLWSTGLGHPDSMYVSDIDPLHTGLEVLYGIEPRQAQNGVCLVDAKTGKILWGIDRQTYHVGGAMTADIDPEWSGLECWAREDSKGGSTDRYMFSADGKEFRDRNDIPGTKNWVFWDGDLLREFVSSSEGEASQSDSFVIKYRGNALTRGIEGRVAAIADIIGDWREEIITALPGELRIYTTTIPAADRRICLMQDPVYRSMITGLTSGYAQNPICSYYLGTPIRNK